VERELWEGPRGGGAAADVSLLSAAELAEHEERKLKLRKVAGCWAFVWRFLFRFALQRIGGRRQGMDRGGALPRQPRPRTRPPAACSHVPTLAAPPPLLATP
jgi:hypothetical protein